jgi:predicted dehydrogenase
MIHKPQVFIALVILCSCTAKQPENEMVKLITLDPGHFHAALVQKTMFESVDSSVYVYAPESQDLQEHLMRIDGYNKRTENPTRWNQIVYRGSDFFERMLAEKKGNVVVLSGNNMKKTEYIKASLDAGLNVLSDKPMAINTDDFELLRASFETASKEGLILYDIMTERSEITTILQKELSMNKELFGDLEKGSLENPAVTKESVHHFYKYVSGSALKRPAWFFDVEQQGEGITDVTTHLVDLIQWECFPEQVIDYNTDIKIESARRWPTVLSPSQFKEVTFLDSYPDYLQKYLSDSLLNVYSNGEINYRIKDIHAKVSVIWNYRAPEGTGDTHFSIMRGTKANLVIRQGKDQNFKPVLYIEPVHDMNRDFVEIVDEAILSIQKKYVGVRSELKENSWEIIIPDNYRISHEEHFGQVMERFLQYLKSGKLPDWEVPNMLAKYYITTKALEIASQTK